MERKFMYHANMKTNTIWKFHISMNTLLKRTFPFSNHSIIKSSSSFKTKFTREKIEDYTCEWNFPIRTLLGKGRRNGVIEELRTKHGAVRPLVVTDCNVQNLPIIQVKRFKLLGIILRHQVYN